MVCHPWASSCYGQTIYQICGAAVHRKADLRELKRLHVQENRLMQALACKAVAAKEEQMKKFETDKQVNAHIYIHVHLRSSSRF